MKNVAFVFPGQGTHYVGMGLEIANSYKEANEVYGLANEVMGMDIRKLCFEGPEDVLLRTENSQPTIHATSIAILKVLEKYGISGDVTAGFSLGQYSALVYGGAFKFEDTVKLVRQRGIFMEEAVPDRKGKMVAIVGLSRDEIFKIVDDSKHLGHIEPSNFNCPGQIIVAGYNAAVDYANKLALERGAKATNFLKVSGPFHTMLLVDAGNKLRKEIDKIEMNNLTKHYVDNVTGKFFTEEEDLKDLLRQHVFRAVKWEDSVESMLERGVDTFIEIGPSSVLTPFNLRTAENLNKKINCFNVEDVKSLENVLRYFDKNAI